MSKAYNEMPYVEIAAIYNDINNIPLDAAVALGESAAKLVGGGAKAFAEIATQPGCHIQPHLAMLFGEGGKFPAQPRSDNVVR